MHTNRHMPSIRKTSLKSRRISCLVILFSALLAPLHPWIERPVQAVSLDFSQVKPVNWMIDEDSPNDSISGNDVGGTKYEIFGSVAQVVNQWLIVGVQANTSIAGTPSALALDGIVRFADIIVKCVSDMKEAFYAINFDDQNESAAPSPGLFENPQLISVANSNGNKLDSFGAYIEWVSKKGGDPTVGSLGFDYFNPEFHVPNILVSGNKVGDVYVLDAQQKSDLGLDAAFAGKPGSTTAVAVDISSLQRTQSACTYYITYECNNDISGGRFEITQVPESDGVASILGAGALVGGISILKKRKDETARNE